MGTNSRMRRGRLGGSDVGGLEWSVNQAEERKRNERPPTSAAGQGRELGRPDPEVLERPQRRRFSAECKARIVQEADACTQIGQVGALLRREGLYSSQLATWRKQYRQGGYAALVDTKRGRKRKKSPLELENERLRKQVSHLERRLQQAEAIIDIQKKASEMLGIPLRAPESDENA